MSQSFSVLVIGDPHFRVKYLRVMHEFTEQTINLIKKKKPNMVVILGDVLHHHEQAREPCHSAAIQWFKDMSKYSHIVVLIGNHDRPNNSHFLTTSHFFNGLKGHKNITIVDKVVSLEVSASKKTYRMVFVPYVPEGRFQEALDTLKQPITEYRPAAIFAHQEFKGVKMGAQVSEKGDEWPLDYPLVITGHIHEYQIPQKNIIYPGTPFQTTYAETANKGVYLFHFPSEKIQRVKMNLKVKESIKISPEMFIENPPSVSETMDLRIIIEGPSDEIESLKLNEKYAEYKKMANVKIVLIKQVDFNTNIKYEKKSFKSALFSEIKDDKNLVDIFNELVK